nr:MAG TPA: hypothetical protein [Caudoviricetes sp.]
MLLLLLLYTLCCLLSTHYYNILSVNFYSWKVFILYL